MRMRVLARDVLLTRPPRARVPTPPMHRAATHTTPHTRHQVENQREMGTFAGTLAEYNPKVIQFGYIAMFSAACPPAALFAALANVLELRFDARKVLAPLP